MKFIFGVIFTNGSNGLLEITAESFGEARQKMRNNLCVRDFWTDASSPHFEPYFRAHNEHQERWTHEN